MANIVALVDFEDGRNAVPLNAFQEDDFTKYITDVQDDVLFKLFGNDLYQLFVADQNPSGVPQSPEFEVLYHPLVVEIGCKEVRSQGMKEMMKGFIHFAWARDMFSKVDTTGVNRNKSENSTNVSTLNYDLTTRYNKSLEMFHAIQKYICDNISDYPTFKGQLVKPVLPL